MAQVKQVLKEITQGKYNLRNIRDAALATADEHQKINKAKYKGTGSQKPRQWRKKDTKSPK
jgi:hypothetical protein